VGLVLADLSAADSTFLEGWIDPLLCSICWSMLMALGWYRFLKYLKAITGPIPTATVSWVEKMFAPHSGNN